jgi:hypothetical protein
MAGGHLVVAMYVRAWLGQDLLSSNVSLRRTGFPQFVRFALSSTSASPEHSGCETISPQVKSREENIAA